VIEATRVNTNSAFDFCTELMTVKSFSEVIELSTAHSRKQFEAVAAQTRNSVRSRRRSRPRPSSR
jgi:hypothetical protein